MTQPQPGHRKAMVFVGVAAVAALAAILWRSSSAPPAHAPKDGGATQTRTRSTEKPPATGRDNEPERVSATSDLDRVRTLRVQDTAGNPVAGAQALTADPSPPIGTSNAAGELRLTRRLVEGDELQIRAEGFWPELLATRNLSDAAVVTLRARSGHTLTVRIVTDRGDAAAGIDLLMAPADDGGTAQEQRQATTDEGGRATIPGIAAGDYQLTLRMGKIDVTGFLRRPDATIRIPAEEAEWILHLPRVAWTKPATGRIVTGYYRAPMGPGDFGRTHGYLRGVEQQLHATHDSSLAQAFTSPTDEVTFVGLVDPGGWMVVPTPVKSLAPDLSPTPIQNAGLDPVEYGQLTVEASTVDGKPVPDAPFALNMTSAGKYGSFSMPITFGEPQRLPVGKYVFVALQAGAAALFDGPKQAIQVTSDSNETVHIRAAKEVRRVRIGATQTTKEGEQLTEVGIIRIKDGSGFETEVRPATQDTIWLPLGQSLQARTRRRHHLVYIDLVCDFFVPPTGEPNITLNLTEKP